VLLSAICTIIWFDRVGLPAFFTDKLVAALHEHGIAMQMPRLPQAPAWKDVDGQLARH